jgi:hypothetical protein
MNADVNDALISAAAVVMVAIVSWLAADRKVRMDLEAKFDEELRTKRLAVYMDLWSRLDSIAASDTPRALDVQEIEAFHHCLKDWYYGGGGLLLSGGRSPMKTVRRTEICIDYPDPAEVSTAHSYTTGSFPFFTDLQSNLRRALARGKGVDDKEFACLKQKASDLRTQLTNDIGTRKVLSQRYRGTED